MGSPRVGYWSWLKRAPTTCHSAHFVAAVPRTSKFRDRPPHTRVLQGGFALDGAEVVARGLTMGRHHVAGSSGARIAHVKTDIRAVDLIRAENGVVAVYGLEAHVVTADGRGRGRVDAYARVRRRLVVLNLSVLAGAC